MYRIADNSKFGYILTIKAQVIIYRDQNLSLIY